MSKLINKNRFDQKEVGNTFFLAFVYFKLFKKLLKLVDFLDDHRVMVQVDFFNKTLFKTFLSHTVTIKFLFDI